MSALLRAAVLITICLLFIVVRPGTSYAEPYVDPDTGYMAVIDDFANLLTAEQQEQLMQKMKELTAYGNMAFVSDLNNAYGSSELYAEEYLYSVLGGGSGSVFLVDLDLRYLYLYSDGEVLRYVSRSKANTITDNCYRYASEGDYLGCAMECFTEMEQVLNGGRIAEPMKYICNGLIALSAALLINYVIVSRSSRLKSANYTQMMQYANAEFKNYVTEPEKTHTTRTYTPRTTGSGSHGGGGRSGGGFGGGGRSGGGGGHRF